MNMHVNISEGNYEIVHAPLKIEEGKFYRSRDGRKFGPMRRFDSEAWRDNDNCGKLWRDDGKRFYGGDEETWFVAEWTEPVVQPKGCAAAQVDYLADEYGSGRKFPVGSRVVRTNGLHDGSGTVTGHTDHRFNTVEWDDGIGSSSNWQDYELRLVTERPEPKFKVGDRVRVRDTYPAPMYRGSLAKVIRLKDCGSVVINSNKWGASSEEPKFLELIAPAPLAGSAIVCLIEDDQPKPATRPFVHHNRAAAEKEAARLAKMHAGKEFAVYERVSSAKEERTFDHEWQRLAVNGRKIDAIKELRSQAGIGLKCAKDSIEDWLSRNG